MQAWRDAEIPRAGFKYKVVEEKGRHPTLSVLYTATIPTATAEVGAGAVGHSAGNPGAQGLLESILSISTRRRNGWGGLEQLDSIAIILRRWPTLAESRESGA
jgi:hypothetical protein